MKKIFISLLVIFPAIPVFTTCSKSETTNDGNGTTFSCVGINPGFSNDVRSILTTVCSINSNCHSDGSTNTGGPLTTYAEVNAKKTNIRAAILSRTMPLSGSISQAQINAFICWIDSGAPNN